MTVVQDTIKKTSTRTVQVKLTIQDLVNLARVKCDRDFQECGEIQAQVGVSSKFSDRFEELDGAESEILVTMTHVEEEKAEQPITLLNPPFPA